MGDDGVTSQDVGDSVRATFQLQRRIHFAGRKNDKGLKQAHKGKEQRTCRLNLVGACRLPCMRPGVSMLP